MEWTSVSILNIGFKFEWISWCTVIRFHRLQWRLKAYQIKTCHSGIMKLSMHQQSIAYKAFRGPQMCPDRAIKPRTALHSARDEANAFTNNARLFFSLLRQPHFYCKTAQKVATPPPCRGRCRARERQHKGAINAKLSLHNCWTCSWSSTAGHKEAINAAQMRLACIKMLNPEPFNCWSAKNCSSKSKSKLPFDHFARAGKQLQLH